MKKRLLLFSVLSVFFLVFSVFIGPISINPFFIDETSWQILISIRLPRVFSSFIIGAGLGCSGAVLQGMLRNSLADPYILGISSGAGLFTTIAFFLSINFLGVFSVPVFSFIGAVLTGVVVGLLSIRKGIVVPER